MKSLLLSAVLISAVILISCKKDDDGGTNPASNGTVSLSYDGTNWTADLSVQAVNTNGVINVTGSDGNARQAAINLFSVTKPGTYKVGPNGSSGNSIRWTEGVDPKQTYTASFVLGSGTITITELSATNIKGTFSGTVYNTDQETKSITNGKFDAKF
ncbi:MAG: DUF6252 family protein [Bacteroidales bacterium]|nr:DUF6252 family protein [Bacteroidales bacterium]MCF6341520.1 DUF6252 family protein [Bacteroidales bacterium]